VSVGIGAEGVISVTFFADHTAATKREEVLHLHDLASRIASTTAPSKTTLPWLKLATLGDHRTGANSLRHNANVLTITGIEADYDGERMSFADACEILRKAGLAAIVYTSPSHTEDAPRWRVVAPFSAEHPPDRRDAFMARLNGLFGGIFSTESWTLSQSYYYGSVNRSPSHRVEVITGIPIDLMSELDAGAIGKPGAKAGNGTERPIGSPGAYTPASDARLEGFRMSVLDNLRRQAVDGQKHTELRSAALALGGIQAAAGFTDAAAVQWLLDALPSSVDDWALAARTAAWGLEQGRARPIEFEDRPHSFGNGTRDHDADPHGTHRPNGENAAPEPPPADEGSASEQPHDGTGQDDTDDETLPFMLFGDIKPALDSNDFVEGLLASSSLAVIYGEPGSGKTFWVLDICLHVAAGRQWRDRAVEQGAVIYLALEGGAGIRNRIAAARERMALSDTTPLVLVQCPVDLCHSGADVAKVITTIKAVAARLGMPVRLVVVDTLARAMAGGNENASEDMGALVANSDTIRDQTKACVLYIHHCGKDAARGSRGHSSLKAATDTEIEVTRGADRVSIARVTRQRDMESEGSFAFRLEPVELGRNQRGKPVTSCVVVTATDAPAVPAEAVPLTNNERIALRCLDQAMKADAIRATVFDDDVEGLVVRTDDWRAWFYREGKPGADRKAQEKAFRRALDGLLAKGRIGTRDDLIWPTSRRS
jgi:hypothetical protein